MTRRSTSSAYTAAREAYAAAGVDVEAALERLDAVPIGLGTGSALAADGSGTAAGDVLLPGDADGLRADAEAALAQIPGPKRLELLPVDLEADAPLAWSAIRPEHFQRWAEWARERKVGLDLAVACGSGRASAAVLTLGYADPGVRSSWIEHARACRAVSAQLGRSLGTPSRTTLRVLDRAELAGDRAAARRRLIEALDAALTDRFPSECQLDAVEGVGASGGGHRAGGDLWLAYAVRRGVALGLAASHDPVEVVAERLAAALPFVPGVLLRMDATRAVGDDAARLERDAQAIALEVVRGGGLDRSVLAVDAGGEPERAVAWAAAARAMRRALLRALLEPAAPAEGEALRLAALEDARALPWAAVWDHYCERGGVAGGKAWLDAVRDRRRAVRVSPAPPPRAPEPPRAGGAASAIERVFDSSEVNAHKERICDIGRRLWQRAYVDGNGGNVSVRLSDALVLCTPTLVSKGFMTPGDLCLVDMDGVQRAGVKRATSEILMHLAIYRAQPLAKACVHAHPPYATGFAVSYVQPSSGHVPEMEVFCGEVPVAAYFTPGTPGVGEAVARLCDRHNTVLMGNHGAVAWGSDVQDAYFKMEILESYCRTLLVAAQVGDPRRFTPEELGALLAIKKRLGIPDGRSP
jgi:L-rhamnose isomerase